MMFGYAKEELLDRNIKIIMTHPHSEMHDTYLKRYFRTHKKRIIGTTRTLKARHKDGSTFLINLEVNEFMEEGEIMFGGKITRVLSQQGSYSPSPSRTALTCSCVSSHDMHCACAVVRVRVRWCVCVCVCVCHVCHVCCVVLLCAEKKHAKEVRYIGNYEVESILAEGLYGQVRLARHHLTKERVRNTLSQSPR